MQRRSFSGSRASKMKLRKSAYCVLREASFIESKPILSLAEMKISIVMFLINSAGELSNIPSILYEDEVLKILSLDQQVAAQNAYNTSETAGFQPRINEPCIVIMDQSDRRKWYFAMCRQRVDATHFLLEHLQLVQPVKTKRFWHYPLRQDKQVTLINQIIPVNVVGACNRKGRNSICELDNWHVIDGIFKGPYMI